MGGAIAHANFLEQVSINHPIHHNVFHENTSKLSNMYHTTIGTHGATHENPSNKKN